MSKLTEEDKGQEDQSNEVQVTDETALIAIGDQEFVVKVDPKFVQRHNDQAHPPPEAQ